MLFIKEKPLGGYAGIDYTIIYLLSSRINSTLSEISFPAVFFRLSITIRRARVMSTWPIAPGYAGPPPQENDRYPWRGPSALHNGVVEISHNDLGHNASFDIIMIA